MSMKYYETLSSTLISFQLSSPMRTEEEYIIINSLLLLLGWVALFVGKHNLESRIVWF